MSFRSTRPGSVSLLWLTWETGCFANFFALFKITRPQEIGLLHNYKTKIGKPSRQLQHTKILCLSHEHSLRNLLGLFLHDLQLVKGFLCFSFSVSQNIGIVSALFGVSEDRWWWRKLGVHVRIRRCQQRWHASAAMLLSLALSQRVLQKKRGYRAGKPYPTKKTIDRGPQYRRSSRVGSSSVLFL